MRDVILYFGKEQNFTENKDKWLDDGESIRIKVKSLQEFFIATLILGLQVSKTQ